MTEDNDLTGRAYEALKFNVNPPEPEDPEDGGEITDPAAAQALARLLGTRKNKS